MMANLTTGLLSEEAEVLESILAVLRHDGPPTHRIEEALALLADRLEIVRLRLRASETEEEAWSVPRRSHETESLGASPSASLVGRSEAMQQVYREIRRVSESPATVLLRGESGTGKELVAKAIHVQGPRAKGAFVGLHCAALTETLLESELFGHERGAFSGAVEMRKGRFELADGGTLFLDEIGDIPPATQVKLLRVLQEKCFERVGGSRLVSVDVRVISATHRDLEAMVRMGSFREDLYYRLNVVPITLPPLRERGGDIPLLIQHFLDRFNKENRRKVRLGKDILALMGRYHWPGNVRELQNCLERLAVMAEHEQVTLENVPASLRGYFADMRQVTGGMRREIVHSVSRVNEPLQDRLQGIERRRLVEALEGAGWVQAKAARILGLTPRQVAYKLRKYRIVPPRE